MTEPLPGQSGAERRILALSREREGLFERLDRIDSTSPERARLLNEVTAINRRIYICEMERERTTCPSCEGLRVCTISTCHRRQVTHKCHRCYGTGAV